MMSVMGQKSKSKRRHENKQQARENSSKPGETQESVENIRFLEWPKNFYVPDGVGIHINITIFPATIPINILMPGFVEDLICCPMGNLTFFD